MIKIEVQSTRAVIRYQEPLTVGLRGAKAQFTFGQDWDGLIKTAVFRQGNKTVTVADIGQEVTIPWEVLEIPGVPVQIGVYGIDSTEKIAIPTVWAVTQPVRPGTDPEGDPSTEPTPGLWEQMLGKLGSLEQLDTTDQSSLVAAINEANRAAYVVTVTKQEDGNYTADKTPDARAAAYRAGKMLLCYWKEHELLMPLSYPNGGREFVFRTVKDQNEYSVKMTSNENVECICIHLATEESKLPNPQKLTIIGAETTEYDGTEDVMVEIPTKVSQLTNDKGYLTKAPVTSVNGQNGAVHISTPLRVTIEELASGVVQSDPPYEELAEFRSEGHLLYCQHGNLELPLAAVTPHLYIFSCIQGGKVHTVMIGPSSVTVTATPLASGGSGSDGITPHIGDNGNWWIGETDTGMPSRGEDAPQEAILYTPQNLTPEQQAQARENIGLDNLPSVGGELETIIDVTTTKETTEIHIPIDTEVMVEKIKNATDFRFYVYAPQDTSNTDITTTGSVSIGFYIAFARQIANVNIIPPANTNNTWGMANIAYFRNKSVAELSPMIVVTRLNNQGSKTEVRCAQLDTTDLKTTNGCYFYVNGSQNMKAGTRVVLEVRQ